MYANHPEMAKRWQEHTPKGKKLPEKVKKAELMTPFDLWHANSLKLASRALALQLVQNGFHNRADLGELVLGRKLRASRGNAQDLYRKYVELSSARGRKHTQQELAAGGFLARGKKQAGLRALSRLISRASDPFYTNPITRQALRFGQGVEQAGARGWANRLGYRALMPVGRALEHTMQAPARAVGEAMSQGAHAALTGAGRVGHHLNQFLGRDPVAGAMRGLNRRAWLDRQLARVPITPQAPQTWRSLPAQSRETSTGSFSIPAHQLATPVDRTVTSVFQAKPKLAALLELQGF